MVREFRTKEEIDEWYRQATQGLARALRLEIECSGVETIGERGDLKLYRTSLRTIGQIMARAYRHIHIRESPEFLRIRDLADKVYEEL